MKPSFNHERGLFFFFIVVSYICPTFILKKFPSYLNHEAKETWTVLLSFVSAIHKSGHNNMYSTLTFRCKGHQSMKWYFNFLSRLLKLRMVMSWVPIRKARFVSKDPLLWKVYPKLNWFWKLLLMPNLHQILNVILLIWRRNLKVISTWFKVTISKRNAVKRYFQREIYHIISF